MRNAIPRRTRWEGRVVKPCTAAALLVALFSALPAFAQEPAVTAARIQGDDFAIKGQVSLVREAGRTSTALVSGSDVTVRSGAARLVLADGSEIDVCGPAHFSVLKSGEAITVALDYGRVHARLSPQVPLTLYTPLVVATPLSISERPRDTVLGVDRAGSVCTHPTHGAMRLEQQLTGAHVVVPQGGEVAVPDGEVESLREAPESCRCDAVLREDLEPRRERTLQLSAARLPRPEETVREPAAPEPPPKPAQAVPTWEVVMPPLTFDSTAPAPPPEPNPRAALLIRQVNVQSAVVFTGKVEAGNAPSAPKDDVAAEEKPAEKKTGFGTKIKNFFRRLFGAKTKDE